MSTLFTLKELKEFAEFAGISENSVREWLVEKSKKPPVTSARLMIIACNIFNVKREDVLHKTRRGGSREDCGFARLFIFKFQREIQGKTFARIGFEMNYRDHASVMSGLKRINQILSYDKDMQVKWENFKNNLI